MLKVKQRCLQDDHEKTVRILNKHTISLKVIKDARKKKRLNEKPGNFVDDLPASLSIGRPCKSVR